MKYGEYIMRNIIKETEKAYLVEQVVYNRRDGNRVNYKWVDKSVCKDRNTQNICGVVIDTVLVPEWLVSNGVW